ncbi:MAG TPA: caspase family protein [Candidatus Competibacter sp.]|nr:caspase family protein [Candidatus Competibacter sp.]HRX62878.1 caspase family protein [Candidatus Competibacter sp.]
MQRHGPRPLGLILVVILGWFTMRLAIGADRALLVGIDQYLKVPRLEGSGNDVRAMRQFALDTLGYRPDQIQVLLDGEATRAGILSALEDWLIKGTQPGDRVLFYYSGHGDQMPDTNGDEDDHYDETLVSVDTEPDEQGGYRNMISDDELDARLTRLVDRDTTVIIDSCHSGTITRGLLDPANRRDRKTLDPVASRSASDFSQSMKSHRNEESLLKGNRQRVVWSAVSPAQVALVEEVNPPGGVFTRRFLAGLRDRKADRNGNGEVSYAELLDYVLRESAAYCQRLGKACNLGLTPTLEVDPAYRGQPVFAFSAKPLPVPDLASELLAHDNPLQAKLEILPSAVFREGEAMQFRVTSPRSGYLVVLDVNAHGKVTQLFPNRYSDKAKKQNRIYANRPITIPDAYHGSLFRAQEPLGPGRLLAVISADPVSLDDLLARHKDLQVIARPETYLTTLAERLQQPWTGDRFNRQTEWSFVEAVYEIKP